MLIAQAQFPKQETLTQFGLDIMYLLAAVAVVIAVVGLIMVDTGLVRRQNVLDNVVQKLIGFLIATGAYAIVGFGVWEWQFYKAFDLGSYGQAISDWWLAGSFMTEFSGNIDPAVAPGADVSQIFFVFLAVYAGFVVVLCHLGGLERIKPSAWYIISAGIGGVFYPLLLWLTWGSTSPLTNAGVHDMLGGFVGYIFAGTFALMLARRVGPRAGAFRPDPQGRMPAPYNLGLTGTGVALLLFAIPFVVVGCLYFFPGDGWFGIAMSTSGVGIVLTNVFMAFVGGGLMGAILAYRESNVVFALLGPLAGSVAGATGFDVIDPWVMLLIGFGAPIPVMLVWKLLQRIGLDEQKIVPLGLGAGIYGALMTGAVAWGTPTGGFLGINSGTYAFQNAEINVGWQAIGVLTAVGMGLAAGLVLVEGLDRVIGLRVSDEEELEGSDQANWHMLPVGAELAPMAERFPAPATSNPTSQQQPTPGTP
jgi:ammonium transporter, Amt family